MTEMGDDVYESLPEGTTVGVTLVAGAMAGIMEHCVMFPVDCVKTRMQSLACETQKSKLHSQGILTNLVTIMREEGRFRPVQGVQAMALGAGPAHAMYFACYEKLKTVLISQTKYSRVPDTVAYGVAGSVATLFHDAIMCPSEVIKQRMQMCCSPYSSCMDCGRTVLKQEGMGAFYRSYSTQLTMNIPFQATHFMVYEAMQRLTNTEGEYKPTSHIVSGAMAGATAAVVTMPLDVCKTLLNTQEAGVLKILDTGKLVGMFTAAKTVYKVAGITGYFQGVRARVLYQMPATAIAWSVYEFFKHFLSQHQQQSRSGGDMYDTLASLQASKVSSKASDNEASSSSESAASCGGVDTKLMDMITDLPRKVRTSRDLVAEGDQREIVEMEKLTFLPKFRTE